ncbi:MAG: hypothetical protein Q7S03_04325 [bacterium]|nr:hypothetical protein [bacterium]
MDAGTAFMNSWIYISAHWGASALIADLFLMLAVFGLYLNIKDLQITARPIEGGATNSQRYAWARTALVGGVVFFTLAIMVLAFR